MLVYFESLLNSFNIDFIGLMFVYVYVGAIAVLFLFVVMINHNNKPLPHPEEVEESSPEDEELVDDEVQQEGPTPLEEPKPKQTIIEVIEEAWSVIWGLAVEGLLAQQQDKQYRI